MKPPQPLVRRTRFGLVVLLLTLTSMVTPIAARGMWQTAPSRTSRPRLHQRLFEVSPLPGPRAIVSILNEGSRVKAGDVVCELDSSDLRDLLENAKIEIDSSQAQWKQHALSVEAAELALKEEEASLAQEKSRLQETLKFSKAKAKLIEDQLKGGSTPSIANGTDLEKAKLAVRATETEDIAEPSEKRLGPLVEALQKAREEMAVARKQLDLRNSEREDLESRITACKIKAKSDGRVVHARWRRGSASTEGFVVLEPGVLVEESQPLFRVQGARPQPPRAGDDTSTPRKASGRREKPVPSPVPATSKG